MICQLAGLTPYFLHFVVGMGRKFSSKDEDFMSCYSTFSAGKGRLVCGPNNNKATSGDSLWGQSSLVCTSAGYLLNASQLPELCYNIRYFEQHGRDLEDPWSCRQSALHHSFSPVSKQSTCVIIQPPEVFEPIEDSERYTMSLHIRYVSAGLANWRQYLDSFAQRIKVLVE